MEPQKYSQKKKLNETKDIHPWFRKELLKRYPNAYIYKPPSGQFGKKGAHDFMCCIDGLFFTVEAKVYPNTMSDMQLKTQLDVHLAGGFSEQLDNRDISIFDFIASYIERFKNNIVKEHNGNE